MSIYARCHYGNYLATVNDNEKHCKRSFLLTHNSFVNHVTYSTYTHAHTQLSHSQHLVVNLHA